MTMVYWAMAFAVAAVGLGIFVRVRQVKQRKIWEERKHRLAARHGVVLP